MRIGWCQKNLTPNVVEYILNLTNRLKRCQDLAVEKMSEMQVRRKAWYDKNAVNRQFKVGDQVEKQMHQEMLMSVPLYKNDTTVTDAWDALQPYFKCCGIAVNYDQSQEVWKRNSNFQSSDKRVPESCCRRRDQASVRQCQGDPGNYAHDKDCYMEMKDFVKNHALILGGIGIGIACLLIVGMMLSCALFLMIN
ncbi:tetraspanin-11-like [Uloborus diversus]|uniref:tetraspanin-11-like n=1 Tax=Uloborus diversus TaxID=327109 RepID=UPI002409F462|nr:tetraspanin-11-like [Uloborus diversus]